MYEQLLAGGDRSNEMLPFGQSTTKLLHTEYGWVDLPGELRLRGRERPDHLAQSCAVANNHQVDVAFGRFSPRGDRSENKGKLDLRSNGAKRFQQDLRNPERLAYD